MAKGVIKIPVKKKQEAVNEERMYQTILLAFSKIAIYGIRIV